MDSITDRSDVKYQLGKLYFQVRDYKKAIKEYKKGLAIDPHSFILLYEIGLAYSKLKNRKQTIRYWKKVVKMAPNTYFADKAREDLKKINR